MTDKRLLEVVQMLAFQSGNHVAQEKINTLIKDRSKQLETFATQVNLVNLEEENKRLKTENENYKEEQERLCSQIDELQIENYKLAAGCCEHVIAGPDGNKTCFRDKEIDQLRAIIDKNDKELTRQCIQLGIASREVTRSRDIIGERDKEIKQLRERLRFDPGGSDKIDELEQAMQFMRHDLEEKDKQIATLNECLNAESKMHTTQLNTLFDASTKLKDALGICHAAMKKHDADRHYHKKSAFTLEVEIAAKALGIEK